jgi:hypothetical protein
MRWFISFLLFFVIASPQFAQDLQPDTLEARSKAHDDRYKPTFYGIEIPPTGARVLLIVDASGSMTTPDSLRTDGGTRWQTLIDEVTSMTNAMQELQASHPHLCFTITLLYEVYRYENGGKPHKGTQAFDLSQPTAREALIKELQATVPGGGANFETTFNDTLWPLVAQQHITHIFFLGDNDIDYFSDRIYSTFNHWYGLTKKEPKEAKQKKLWRLKCAWYEPWKRWRPPTQRRTLELRKSDLLRLPPPPREVTFSAIAIGESSPLLKTFTEIARGTYVERK